MKKLLAVLLSIMMLAMPLTSMAENSVWDNAARQETTITIHDLNADLVAALGGDDTAMAAINDLLAALSLTGYQQGDEALEKCAGRVVVQQRVEAVGCLPEGVCVRKCRRRGLDRVCKLLRGSAVEAREEREQAGNAGYHARLHVRDGSAESTGRTRHERRCRKRANHPGDVVAKGNARNAPHEEGRRKQARKLAKPRAEKRSHEHAPARHGGERLSGA